MIDFDKGLLCRGRWGRLQAVMDRAAAGGAVTVAFLGGSITQGSLASTPEKCYAYLVYRWWQERFPNARIRYINAGIGGTDSQFGAARVGEDVLAHDPDFVLTEFSVNDSATAHYQETYEGLIRILAESGRALLLMNNVCYDSGLSAESVHIPVAEHYGVPSVSIRSTVYAAVERGELERRDITPDDLHPNDAGHALVARCVCHVLDRIWEAPREPVCREPLPPPITPNRYQDSRRWRNDNSAPAFQGFLPDPEPQEHITQCFRRGFFAGRAGDSITFTLDGRCVAVQYRKSVRHPAPIAKVTVDGGHETVLDANFRETWGDCLYLQTVCEDLTPGPHEIRVEICQATEADAVPFYLVSVITSQGGGT